MAKGLVWSLMLVGCGAANAGGLPPRVVPVGDEALPVLPGTVDRIRFATAMRVDGTMEFGPWIEAGSFGGVAGRGVEKVQFDAFDSYGTSVNEDLNGDGFSGSVLGETIGQQLCGDFGTFGDLFGVQRMAHQFSVEPGTEGALIDGVAFLVHVTGAESIDGGDRDCVFPVASFAIFDESDDGVDLDADGVPDDVVGFPVYDSAGQLTDEVTFYRNLTSDLDSDGTPDVGDPSDYGDQDGDGELDGFLGGFEISFSFPTQAADGTPIYDATPCPDRNFDGLENDGVRPPLPGLISLETFIFGTVGDADGTGGVVCNIADAIDFFGGEDALPRLPQDGSGTYELFLQNEAGEIGGDGQPIREPMPGGHFALGARPSEIGFDDGNGPSRRPGAVNGATWFEGTEWSNRPVDRFFAIDRLNPGGDVEALWEQDSPSACPSLELVPAFYVAAGEVGVGARLCADVNDDGILNGADFNAWLGAFSVGSSLGDQNRDGVLNGADFNAWLGNFSAGADGPTCNP